MLDNNNSRSHSLTNTVLGAILLLLCTGNAFGKAKHIGQLFWESGTEIGKPRSGAQVYVYSGTALATLYSDSE